MCGSPKVRAIVEAPASKSAGSFDSNASNSTCDAFPSLCSTSPPLTPRTPTMRSSVHMPSSFTPPPMLPMSGAGMPALRKALQSNSIDQVRKALEDDPSLAKEPFWEHDLEPPLYCAVRCRCDTAIVQKLLDCGASAQDTDKHGRTPMRLLREMQGPTSTASEMLPNPFGAANSLRFPGFEKFGTSMAPCFSQINCVDAPWYASNVKLFDESLFAPSKGDADWFQEIMQLLSCP